MSQNVAGCRKRGSEAPAFRRGERHVERHPLPDEVALVVEVSDTTLQRDRGVKLRLYAEAGIPAYWIINLPDQQLEAHTVPEGNTYKTSGIYTLSDGI